MCTYEPGGFLLALKAQQKLPIPSILLSLQAFESYLRSYCSSDSHAGNSTTATGSSGHAWHFRGKEIVRAVVAELVQLLGEVGVRRTDPLDEFEHTVCA